MNYFWVGVIAAIVMCGVFIFCAMFLSGSRCREEEYEQEIDELLKVIADNDAELAQVSQERDQLQKRLNALTSMRVIDMTQRREFA